MSDYKEMYLHLLRETEKAIRILIKAQQRCEEIYLNGTDAEVIVFPAEPEQKFNEETPKWPF